MGSLELDGEVWAMLYSVLHDLKLLLLYYRSYGDTAEDSGKRKKGSKQKAVPSLQGQEAPFIHTCCVYGDLNQG